MLSVWRRCPWFESRMMVFLLCDISFLLVRVSTYVRWLRCRLSNREVSFISYVRIHSAAAAAATAVTVCYLLICFSFFYVDTVCGFITTEYLDLIDYNYTRCCTTYEYVFVYTCHVLLLLLLCSVLLCRKVRVLMPWPSRGPMGCSIVVVIVEDRGREEESEK